MVLTYIGLGVLSCAAIVATWRIMNRPKKSCDRLFFDCLADPEGCGRVLFPPEDCGVCGRWFSAPTCPDCEAWAKELTVDAFFGGMTTCYEQYDGHMWPNEIEHRRLVKKVGW